MNVKPPVISTLNSAPTAGIVPADNRASPTHRPSTATFFASIFLGVRQTKGAICSRHLTLKSLFFANLSAPNLSHRWETLRARLPRCSKIPARALSFRFLQRVGLYKAAGSGGL